MGLSVFIAGLVNDIFIANSKTAVSKDYSIHFALQLFVFLQAILIIRTWIQAYLEKGRLMAEIEDINVNLEKRVDALLTDEYYERSSVAITQACTCVGPGSTGGRNMAGLLLLAVYQSSLVFFLGCFRRR